MSCRLMGYYRSHWIVWKVKLNELTGLSAFLNLQILFSKAVKMKCCCVRKGLINKLWCIWENTALLYTRYSLLFKGGNYINLSNCIAFLNIRKALTLCQVLCEEVAVQGWISLVPTPKNLPVLWVTWNHRQLQCSKQKKRHRCTEQTLDSVGEGEGGMFQENSIETCIVSRVKQITSPGWMHEISARTWCTGKT